MKKMIIMLENENTRYEFYMRPIHRSNVDDTVVRWELRYNHIKSMCTGSSVSYDQRLYGVTFAEFINKLLLAGYEEVTFETKKFA